MNQQPSHVEQGHRVASVAETGLPVSKRIAGAANPGSTAVRDEPATVATLPFTTLEEWLFWEDRPAYPWTCFTRLRFRGQLDRAAFETAVREVLRRHSLLRSRARMRGRTHLEWVIEEDPRPTITWRAGLPGGPFPTTMPVDLFREIGMRFHVVSDGCNCDLILEFHHACCDGIGSLSLANELLIAYTLALGTSVDGLCLPPLKPDGLAVRNTFGFTPGKRVRISLSHLLRFQDAARFLWREPAPLVPHRPCEDAGPSPPGYPATVGGVLDHAESSRLRETAARRGARLNDLLACELFLALADWRARWNIPEQDDWLRMMIPLNLCAQQDRGLLVASLASFVCLDRRRRDFADPARLLTGIHNQMSMTLDRQLGFMFVASCQMLNLIPGMLKTHIRRRRCRVSCVLTNLGRAFARSPLPREADRLVAGNVTLEDVDGLAPICPYTCASFATATYAGRLTVTLHYDPRPLTRQQAADLLDTFIQRLRTL